MRRAQREREREREMEMEERKSRRIARQDTKKKELVENFNVRNFKIEKLGRVNLYGIYDVTHNEE